MPSGGKRPLLHVFVGLHDAGPQKIERTQDTLQPTTVVRGKGCIPATSVLPPTLGNLQHNISSDTNLWYKVKPILVMHKADHYGMAHFLGRSPLHVSTAMKSTHLLMDIPFNG